MIAAEKITDHLIRNSGQRFCEECLSRVSGIRNQVNVARAVRDLTTKQVYRREESECSRCGKTRLTVRALWAGV
jgi:hypothetical protein